MPDAVECLELTMLERLAQPLRRIRTDRRILAAPEQQSWDICDAGQRRLRFRKIAIPRTHHAQTIVKGPGNLESSRIASERARMYASGVAVKATQQQIMDVRQE